MARRALTDEQLLDAVLDLEALLRVEAGGINVALKAIGAKYGVSRTTIRRAAETLEFDLSQYSARDARVRVKAAQDALRTRSLADKASMATRLVRHLERELDYLDEQLVKHGTLTPQDSARLGRALIGLQRSLALDAELVSRGHRVPGFGEDPDKPSGGEEQPSNVTHADAMQEARDRVRRMREAAAGGES